MVCLLFAQKPVVKEKTLHTTYELIFLGLRHADRLHHLAPPAFLVSTLAMFSSAKFTGFLSKYFVHVLCA